MGRPVTFGMGQVDRQFWHQVDVDDYWRSCQVCNNVIINAQGAATRRPGLLNGRNITSLINEPSFKYDVIYLQSVAGNMVTVEVLFIGNQVCLSADGAAWQTVTLTDYDPDQVLQITYFAAQTNLILAHKDVAPHRIFFDGTTFTYETYPIVRGPCWDFGKVDYYSATAVTLSIDMTSKNTKATLNVYFPNVSDWIGGNILGPGTTTTSPLGFGVIIDAASTESPASTTFTLSTTADFDTTGNINISGFGLVIRQPLFTDELGYPAEGCFYQGRIFFTRHPLLVNTVFASKTTAVSIFDVGIGYATDGLMETPETTLGDNLFLAVGKTLELFTSQAVCITPMSNEGLAPDNFNFVRQTGDVCLSTCRPVTYQNSTFFAGADGSSIYMFYVAIDQYLGMMYKSAAISRYSTSLIRAPKKLKVFTGSAGTLYLLAVLNSDNSLVIFQYNEVLNISAWTPLSFDPGIEIIDIGSTIGQLYLLVKYTLTNQYYIEYLDPTTIAYVDGAMSVSFSSSPSPILVAGLDKFNGYKVAVSDGITYLGSYLVVAGEINVNFTLPSSTFMGYVGLDYRATLVPMYMTNDLMSAYNLKIVNVVYVSYQDSVAITVDGYPIPYQTYSEIQSGQPLSLKTGTYLYAPVKNQDSSLDDPDRFQKVVISQSAPVAWKILSLSYKITAGLA